MIMMSSRVVDLNRCVGVCFIYLGVYSVRVRD